MYSQGSTILRIEMKIKVKLRIRRRMCYRIFTRRNSFRLTIGHKVALLSNHFAYLIIFQLRMRKIMTQGLCFQALKSKRSRKRKFQCNIWAVTAINLMVGEVDRKRIWIITIQTHWHSLVTQWSYTTSLTKFIKVLHPIKICQAFYIEKSRMSKP